ncbi:MAG: hypothetical protein ACT4NU_00115 [Chromatiales bacterium]
MRFIPWSWAALIGLVAWAYYPGLSGGFEFDDDANIVRNLELVSTTLSVDELWRATLSGFSGALGRPVSMFTFGLQAACTGLDPFPMKVVNLVIHGMTGIALYPLALALLRRLQALRPIPLSPDVVALIVTAIWLLHPLHVTAVSYIVQRMTGLSALFTALAMWVYVVERNHQQQGAERWYVMGPLVGLLGLFAVLAKETGLLLPVYLLVVEVFLFRFQAQRRVDRLAIGVLHGIFALGALIVGTYVLVRHPDVALAGYPGRPFTMVERLLTESRVLVWYLGMILVPDISQMTLYHDNFAISRSLLSPPTTLPSILTLLGLALLGWWSRVKAPWFGFGVFWFLGGHLLESTILPLELVYEHRNYLPAFGIIFTVIYGLARAAAVMSRPKQHVMTVVFFLGVATLAWATHTRAYVWSDAPSAALLDAEHHPDSPRANMAAGTRYAGYAKGATDRNDRDAFMRLAERHFRKAAELVPDSANALIAVMLMYYEQGLAPPADVPSEVKRLLSTGRIDAATVNGLQAMTDCKIKGDCTFSDEYYLAVMDSAFQNPDVLDMYASNLVRCMAKFYSEGRGDHDAAIMLTKRAMELNPRQIGIRLEVIQDLIRAGYLATALEELAVLEREDKLGRYRAYITPWREDIERTLESVPQGNSN